MTERVVRGFISGKPRYFPAKEGKQEVAYVRIGVPRWEKQGEEFKELETQWLEAHFYGRWANAIHEKYQVGDDLVIAGRSEMKVVVRDGREFQNEHLYVQAFGPDALRSNIEIVRTRDAKQHQTDPMNASQAASAAVAADPQREATAEALMVHRLGLLLEAGYLSEQMGDTTMRALTSGGSTFDIKRQVYDSLKAGDLRHNAQVEQYLLSVVDSHAGLGRPLTWDEARSAGEDVMLEKADWSKTQRPLSEVQNLEEERAQFARGNDPASGFAATEENNFAEELRKAIQDRHLGVDGRDIFMEIWRSDSRANDRNLDIALIPSDVKVENSVRRFVRGAFAQKDGLGPALSWEEARADAGYGPRPLTRGQKNDLAREQALEAASENRSQLVGAATPESVEARVETTPAPQPVPAAVPAPTVDTPPVSAQNNPWALVEQARRDIASTQSVQRMEQDRQILGAQTHTM